MYGNGGAILKMENTPEANAEATEETILTPVRAIRAHCLHCCGYSPKEVRLCTVHSCDLYPYRMGHSPGRKGKGGKAKQQESENQASECWKTPAESHELV